MAGAVAQVMKRVPRIKFQQRRQKAASESASTPNDANDFFYPVSSKLASMTLGGKASLQPKRTPISAVEMDAIFWVAASNTSFTTRRISFARN